MAQSFVVGGIHTSREIPSDHLTQDENFILLLAIGSGVLRIDNTRQPGCEVV